ncbi:MAG: hypothetical protein LBS31_06855 [Candidatus Adiutrix sp.]|nr:hypothetical protein [Candidatus Adiutrix sp.]
MATSITRFTISGESARLTTLRGRPTGRLAGAAGAAASAAAAAGPARTSRPP